MLLNPANFLVRLTQSCRFGAPSLVWSNNRWSLTIITLLWNFWISQPCWADNAKSIPKAIFVIVDGVPADVIERVATPHLDSIAAKGGYSRGWVGGVIGTSAETPTISAPGYMSLVTGTWANKHNVRTNYDLAPNYDYWNLFRLAKAVNPDLLIAIFSTWTDNRVVLLGEGRSEAGGFEFDYVADGFENDTERFPNQDNGHHIELIDQYVAAGAANVVQWVGPDLSWVYLQHTDDVGHKHGDGSELDLAAQSMDTLLGKIWSSVKARKRRYREDWLVLVTTDHGRDAETGRNHGGQSERERTIWITTNSGRLNQRFYSRPAIVDIYPSIAAHLDLAIPDAVARHLEGKTFIDRYANQD